jgi:hypothetical protein
MVNVDGDADLVGQSRRFGRPGRPTGGCHSGYSILSNAYHLGYRVAQNGDVRTPALLDVKETRRAPSSLQRFYTVAQIACTIPRTAQLTFPWWLSWPPTARTTA